MSEDPDTSEEDMAEMYLQLFELFENACARHEASQDPEFRRMPPDAAKAAVDRMSEVRLFMDSCRLSSLAFHRVLERLPTMPWYEQDRGLLATHVTVQALLPSAFSDPGSLPRTDLGAEIRNGRGALKSAYPHLYGDGLWMFPLTWDEEGDLDSLSAHVDIITDAIFDVPDEDPLDLLDDRIELEGLVIEVEEVDPLFLAEVKSIRASALRTIKRMTEEGWDSPSDWLRDDMERGQGMALWAISRFVLESMMIRMRQGMDKESSRELMGEPRLPATAADVVKQGTFAFTPKGASESLRLLRSIHQHEEAALYRLEAGSRAMHELQDVGSARALISAALASLKPSHPSWPRIAFQAAFVEAEEDYGAAMKLADGIIEEGKRTDDAGIETLGWMSRAQIAFLCENVDDLAPAYNHMVGMILGNDSDPVVLKTLVLVVPLCQTLGDPGTARRLLRIGLKRTAKRPDLKGLREKLEDIEMSMKGYQW